MSRTLPRSLLIGIGIAAVVAATGTARAQTFQFADVVGWWSAEPEFAGETSRIVLHFLEENGKQTARLSLLGIGGYEVPIGTVTIDGMTLDMKPLSVPAAVRSAARHAARTAAGGGGAGLQNSSGVSPHRAARQAQAANVGLPASARALDLRHRRRRVGRHRARCRERADLRRQRCGHVARARCEGREALEIRDRQAGQGAAHGDRRLGLPRVRQRFSLQARQAQRRGALARADRSRQPGAHSGRARKDRVGIATAPASSPTASASTSAAATERCTRSMSPRAKSSGACRPRT